jgi:hypothetical protein
MPATYDIYRNLNKARRDPTRNVWSLRTKVNGRPKVVGHSTDAMLTDVVFKVAESTRQRVIDNQRKSVCAIVRGTFVDRLPLHLRDYLATGDRISFNPYTSDRFYVCETGQPITRADAVIFTVNGAYAINPS